MPCADHILTISNLHTRYHLDEGVVRAVDGVNLVIPRGETVALVGESGCGKSAVALSILRLIAPPGRITDGTITLYRDDQAVNLTALTEGGKAIREIRGREIAMVFQEPMTALSPVHTVGSQILESIHLHTPLRGQAAKAAAIEAMEQVGIPEAARRYREHPHALSGGLRQRAVIALALACRPALLIADEPTTALDVTIQAQILSLLRDLQRELGMSILLITHDLGVVAEMARQVAVMYAGRIVEQSGVQELFRDPQHPYTRALLQSIPSHAPRKSVLQTIPGSVPDPLHPLPGCPFHPRCTQAVPGLCNVGARPALVETAPGHQAACVLLAEP